MKKVVGLIVATTLLGGCSSAQIHPDLEADAEQMIDLLNAAYEEKDFLNSDDSGIADQFEAKYLPGNFVDSDGEEYVMNDLEKSLAHEIDKVRPFTFAEETLSSEDDVFTKGMKRIESLMEGDTDLVIEDFYSNYERYDGIHPEFMAVVKPYFMALDPVVNTNQTTLDPMYIDGLESFTIDYSGIGFKTDDGYIAHSEESKAIYVALLNISFDIEEQSAISNHSMDDFNEVKDLVDF